MDGDVRVEVFHFRVYDGGSDQFIIPPLKSPKARIVEVGGQIIPGTSEMVSLSSLDGEGRYKPIIPYDPTKP